MPVQSTFTSPNQVFLGAIDQTAQVNVAPANPQRLGLYVFNASAANTLWITPGGTQATVGNGVAVQPSQGVMFGPPNMPPWTKQMNIIASASSEVSVLEFYA